ncbi:hypothetical protein Tco_0993435 [Tanacetum coccineum]
MVSATKDPLTFDKLMATPIDFSNNIKLKYNIEECFKALTDILDWNNPEGDHYPFELTKPIPLKGSPCHLTVVVEYFFNNDMEFLKLSDPEKKSQINKYSKHNVYSTQKILGVKSVSVKKLHGYGHLEEIVVKRVDRQLYKFKESNFVDLHLNDIENSCFFLAFNTKLFHLDGSDIVDFIVALRMFIRSLIMKRRVEDLQLGVKTDELYKFLDGTLKTVRNELHHRILDFRLGCNKEMSRRKVEAIRLKRGSEIHGRLLDKQLRGEGEEGSFEFGAIGWCSGTRDGLKNDDSYCMIIRSNLNSYLVNNVNM